MLHHALRYMADSLRHTAARSSQWHSGRHVFCRPLLRDEGSITNLGHGALLAQRAVELICTGLVTVVGPVSLPGGSLLALRVVSGQC